jgi:hypothetical protein
MLHHDDWDVPIKVSNRWATVEELRGVISENLGIEPKLQVLYFNERELSDQLKPITHAGIRVKDQQWVPTFPLINRAFRTFLQRTIFPHLKSLFANVRFFKATCWGSPLYMWFEIEPATGEISGEGFCGAIGGDFIVSGTLTRAGIIENPAAFMDDPMVASSTVASAKDRYNLCFTIQLDPKDFLEAKVMREIRATASKKELEKMQYLRVCNRNQ